MEDRINYCTKKCKRWPSKLCSASYQRKGYLIIKEIIIIPGISFWNLDAPEANTHQTFKRSHYWKEASEQYVLSLTAYHSSLRPPEVASDREYMYFSTILMGSDRGSSSRLCIKAAKRSFSGWSHIWTCWDLKMTLRRKGERSVDSLHSDVCMEYSDQMSTSDHGLRFLYRICWVLVLFGLEFLFFFLSLSHYVLSTC